MRPNPTVKYTGLWWLQTRTLYLRTKLWQKLSNQPLFRQSKLPKETGATIATLVLCHITQVVHIVCTLSTVSTVLQSGQVFF